MVSPNQVRLVLILHATEATTIQLSTLDGCHTRQPPRPIRRCLGPPRAIRRGGQRTRLRPGIDNLARLLRGRPRRHTMENSDVNPYFDSIFAIGSSPRSRAAKASVQAVSPG